MAKRIMCIIISVLMIVSLLPTGVFAVENDIGESAPEVVLTSTADADSGETTEGESTQEGGSSESTEANEGISLASEEGADVVTVKFGSSATAKTESYTSIDDAVKAVADSNTVYFTLLDNVSTTSNLNFLATKTYIDLAGYSLSCGAIAVGDDSDYMGLTLTIQNGTGTINCSGITVGYDGKLVVTSDVTIISTGTSLFSGGGEISSLTTGTFSHDVSAYCATGYTTVKDETTSYYKVVVDNKVAKIGETGYSSITEALSAASDGATVTVIKDVSGEAVSYSNTASVTLDLAGYALNLTSLSVTAGTLTITDSVGGSTASSLGTISAIADNLKIIGGTYSDTSSLSTYVPYGYSISDSGTVSQTVATFTIGSYNSSVVTVSGVELTVNGQGKIVNDNNIPYTYTGHVGDVIVITASATITNQNYTFKGWYNNTAGTGDAVATSTSNVEGKYTITSVSITLSENTAVYAVCEQDSDKKSACETWLETASEGVYTISSISDWQNFVYAVNTLGTDFTGKTVQLTTDLDFSAYANVINPVGTVTNKFTGIFDGQDHTISNMTYESNGLYAGVFGVVSGATIKNLNVTNSSFKVSSNSSGYYAGGIVADAQSNSTIENCTVSNVTVEGWFSGGIAGHTYGATFNNVTATDVAFSAVAKSGCIVGYAEALTINGATVTSSLTANSSGMPAAVVGQATGNETLSNLVVNASGLNVIGTMETANTYTVTIDGENTNITAAAIAGNYSGTNATLTVSAGTYSFDVSDYVAEDKDSVANTDGTYTVTTGVAAVYDGDTCVAVYGSLADAISEASSGNTVKLLSNVSLTETLEIFKSITLDLGDYTITSTAESERGAIYTTQSLTITANEGGGISSSASNAIVNQKGNGTGELTIDGGRYTSSADNAIYNNNGTVTIKSGTISSTCESGRDGIRGYADATIIVEGGTISGTRYGIYSIYDLEISGGTIYSDSNTTNSGVRLDGGDATISGGTIKGYEGFRQVATSGEITISGGTFEGVTHAVNVCTTATVSGGTFTATGTKDQYAVALYSNGATITVTGGTFSGMYSTAWIYSGSNGKITVPEGYIVDTGTLMDSNSGDTALVRTVFKIAASVTSGSTTTYYETFDEAFAAATTDGDTIKLFDDVTWTLTANKKITVGLTFDLNGKTLTLDGSKYIYFAPGSSSTVTFKDSSYTEGDKVTGTVKGAYKSVSYGMIRFNNGCNVVLENVIFENTSYACVMEIGASSGVDINLTATNCQFINSNTSDKYSSKIYSQGVLLYGNSANATGTISFTNCTFETSDSGENGAALKICQGKDAMTGAITINGCTITNNGTTTACAALQFGTSLNSKVTVTNSTMTANNGYAVDAYYDIASTADITLGDGNTVNGVVYIRNGGIRNYTIKITGGCYNNGDDVAIKAASDASSSTPILNLLKLTGGYFKTDVSDLVANGYSCINNDGNAGDYYNSTYATAGYAYVVKQDAGATNYFVVGDDNVKHYYSSLTALLTNTDNCTGIAYFAADCALTVADISAINENGWTVKNYGGATLTYGDTLANLVSALTAGDLEVTTLVYKYDDSTNHTMGNVSLVNGALVAGSTTDMSSSDASNWAYYTENVLGEDYVYYTAGTTYTIYNKANRSATAMIGDNVYVDPLSTAITKINALSSSDSSATWTLTLLTNASTNVSLNGSTNLIFDLNGKTLTGCVYVNGVESDGGNVTVKNGTITKSNSDYFLVYTNGTLKDVTLTLDNVILTHTGSTGIAVYLASGGTTTITNCTVSGATGIVARSSDLTIKNTTVIATGAYGEYDNTYSGGAQSTGDAIMLIASGYPGGTPEIREFSGVNAYSAYGKAVVLETYTGITEESENYYSTTKFIKDGNYSSDVTEYCLDGYGATSGTYEVDGTSYSYSVNAAVATVTSGTTVTSYATLDEALSAATNGSTVTLLANVEVKEDLSAETSGTVTLDLAGNDLTINTGVTLTVASGTTVVIKDSSSAGLVTNNGTISVAGTLDIRDLGYTTDSENGSGLLGQLNGKITLASTGTFIVPDVWATQWSSLGEWKPTWTSATSASGIFSSVAQGATVYSYGKGWECTTAFESSNYDSSITYWTVSGTYLVEYFKQSNGEVLDSSKWSYPVAVENNTIFAGWYTDSTCASVYSATSGVAYAKFVQLSTDDNGYGIITFLGGSLRMDSTVSGDYSSTSLRFGYDIAIPTDCDTTYSWSWTWTRDGSVTVHSADGQYYTDAKYSNYSSIGTTTFRSNLVITGISSSFYETDIHSTLTVTYKTLDGTTVNATDTTVRTRDVNEVATSISSSESATDDEKTYASGILSYGEGNIESGGD